MFGDIKNALKRNIINKGWFHKSRIKEKLQIRYYHATEYKVFMTRNVINNMHYFKKISENKTIQCHLYV